MDYQDGQIGMEHASRVHREDVKSALRKRYRTLEKFAATRGLKAQAVRDCLRGKTSQDVHRIIAGELGIEPEKFVIVQSIDVDDSGQPLAAHRLNFEAR